MTSTSNEIDSNVLRAVIKSDNNKDIDDLVEEVDNLILLFKEFKEELVEDMCQVVGLYVDRYAMDEYERNKKEQMWDKGQLLWNVYHPFET